MTCTRGGGCPCRRSCFDYGTQPPPEQFWDVACTSSRQDGSRRFEACTAHEQIWLPMARSPRDRHSSDDDHPAVPRSHQQQSRWQQQQQHAAPLGQGLATQLFLTCTTRCTWRRCCLTLWSPRTRPALGAGMGRDHHIINGRSNSTPINQWPKHYTTSLLSRRTVALQAHGRLLREGKPGVSKPGGFPLFSRKVRIIMSQTLSGLYLAGAANYRPRKTKSTNQEILDNPRTNRPKKERKEGQVQIGKSPFETPSTSP